LRDQILQNLGTARGDAPAVPGDHAFADALAMSIAQITDQGTGRKTVAPAVLKARSEARALMVQLIVEARAAARSRATRSSTRSTSTRCWSIRSGSAPITSSGRPDRMAGRSERGDAAGERGRGGHLQGVLRLDRHLAGEPSAAGARQQGHPGGLVVHGRPLVRPAASAEPSNGISGEGGLRIAHLERPGAHKEVRVLGTVAQPARQQA
jgi:hypothetical protein